MRNYKYSIGVVLLTSVLLQSCVSDGIPEGGIVDHYLEGCSKKINGAMVPIRCPSYDPPVLSTDQRLDSLERFDDFLKSPNHEIARQLARQREQDNSETYFNTEGYHFYYRDPIEMMSGDKFIIQLAFRNYSLFPYKYYNHSGFRTDRYSNWEKFGANSSQSFTNKWQELIFKRYLGEDYDYFQPQLGVVSDDTVGIRVLVDGYSELEMVIFRDPLYSVLHIGDPVAILEEILVTE